MRIASPCRVLTGDACTLGGFAFEKRALKFPAWLASLLMATFFWIASASYLSQALDYSKAFCLATGTVSALFGAATCILLLACGRTPLLMALIGAFLGLACSSFAAYGMHCDIQIASRETKGSWELRVVEDSKESEFGSSCVAQCRLSSGKKAKVRVNLPEGASVDCWQTIYAQGELRTPSEQSRGRYWQKACVASISPSSIRVEDPGGLLGSIVELCERGVALLESSTKSESFWADAEALLKAVLFGDRRLLFSSDLYSVMKTVGLAHIVAVSGAHLVMVTSFFLLALQCMGVPRKLCIPMQLSVVVSYACLTGLPVSVLRAGVMSACALLSFYAKRASSPVNALSVCVLGIIAVNPFLSLSVSLALSACASLGIMLLARKLGSVFLFLASGHGKAVLDSFAVCLSANAFTLPISISTFGQIPLIAPVSNLVSAPVFPILVCYGMLACAVSLIAPPLAGLLMFPLLCIAKLFCVVSRLLAGVPFACVPADGNLVGLALLSVTAVVAFLLTYEKVPPCFYALVALAAVGILLVSGVVRPLIRGDELVALDVGQGDSLLLCSGEHAVLVDTGTDDVQLLRGLSRYGVRSLDAVVITHPDDDHCGSLDALLATARVGRVCVTQGVLSSNEDKCKKLADVLSDCKTEELLAGDSMRFGCYSLEVLSPSEETSDGQNADSLVILVEADMDNDGLGDWRFLLTGDAESEVLEGLASDGKLQDIDVLKVPHHGSKAALTGEVLDELQPEIALISVGENNRYNHPSDEALGLLSYAGAEIFRTDEMGDVVCKLTRNEIKVQCVK